MFGLFGKKPGLPTPEQALPGRAQAMLVPAKHFVLGTPLDGPFPVGIQLALFGNGCFWGTEKQFWQLPGVYSTAVGYAGGLTPNPNYREVCSGLTGHNEVVRVAYDPDRISYADLLKAFWESHDPTQGMGQGPDRGTQYRSGIYCYTPEQKQIALASQAAYQAVLKAKGYGAITTEIIDVPTFYFAEEYHQQYLDKPGSRPYCGAQPTGADLPHPDQWNLPAELKSQLTAHPEVWSKNFAECPVVPH
ncbi:peptide-methionine (S)-S-oxide reductase MsrA [Synechococcus elongatus]|uniref:peptide-methionine (S)-S-oxide reductase MsrA n=1 Tax=Synechococcus elongatus TaxID=32046 RepID=UPI0030D07AAF